MPLLLLLLVLLLLLLLVLLLLLPGLRWATPPPLRKSSI